MALAEALEHECIIGTSFVNIISIKKKWLKNEIS